jgi:DNA-binding XRE family transcriptional regulator
MHESHSLPTLIRQALIGKGRTQRELAVQFGVGETTVRAWETGHHRPSLTLVSGEGKAAFPSPKLSN